MPTRPSTDAAIDAFVARTNAGLRPPRPAADIPERLRDGPVDARGEVGWRIVPVVVAPWVEALEARLPGRFPPSFRSLVARYAFPALELGRFRLFASSGEPELDEELGVRLFRDPALAQVALGAGYLQVGVPVRSGYDPVCFQLGGRRGGGECPLVQLDHEAALQHAEARVARQVAASFLELVAAARAP
jgi:hypothetical protein